MCGAAILLKIPTHCFITSSIPSNVLLTFAMLLLSSSSAFSIFSTIFHFRLRSSLAHWSNWVSGPARVVSFFVTTASEKFFSLFAVTWSLDWCWACRSFVLRRILKCCFRVWFCKIILTPPLSTWIGFLVWHWWASISWVRRVDRITNSSYCRTISPDILANSIKSKNNSVTATFLSGIYSFFELCSDLFKFADTLSFVMTASTIS